MINNLFSQLGKSPTTSMGSTLPSKVNTAIPPKPSFPMAQPATTLFDNGFNHGQFLNNLNSAGKLQRFDWSNGLDKTPNEGMRSYSDGEFVYSPMWQMMTQGSGVDMADIGYNKDFPVSVSRSRIADLVRHSDGRYERPIGSTNWILDPNTGQVLETNVKQKDNSLKEFAGAAALAFGGAAGLSALLGGGLAGTAAGVNAATGVPFSVIPEAAAFTPMAGADVASLVGGTAGFGVQGAAGAGAAGAAAGLTGVPPPANPFTPSSYLNPTNLKNAITSPMGIEKLFSNPLTRNIAGQAVGSLFSGGGGSNPMGGGGTSSGGFGMDTNLMNILGLGAGAYALKEQVDSSKHMLDWLNGQQAKIDNLYSPGSPEFNSLWDQMSRNDAAAGRNSQYGPRSVDLGARIAEIKAKNTANLTTGIGSAYAAALNRRSDAFAGLPGLLNYLGQRGGAQGGGGNSVLNSVGNSIGDFFMNRNPSTGVPFSVIPQSSPFTPSSSFDVDEMVNGFGYGGGFDFGGFEDIGSFF